MKNESDILKEIKYLTQLKSERFNDVQLSELVKNTDYGKKASANLKAIRKRNISAGDPTLSAHGRFQDDFPGVKDSYIDKYNANRWRGYLICEGPDPHPKKRDTAIQRFIENVLVNPNHYEIDIATLLIVGSASDKLKEYDNVDAFADYFSHECNYGPYTLKPLKLEKDKSTPGIRHIRLMVKQNGKEIKEIDVYQVLKTPNTIVDLNEKDIELLQEIAQTNATKMSTHDATGLDYAAAFILAFYIYQHFDTLVDEDSKISQKFLKDLKKLNVARPGAIQNSTQFIFAIKLAFELYQVKLNQAKTKFIKANSDKDSQMSHPFTLVTPSQSQRTDGNNREPFLYRRHSGTQGRVNVRFAKSGSWSQNDAQGRLIGEEIKYLYKPESFNNGDAPASNNDLNEIVRAATPYPTAAQTKSITIPTNRDGSLKDASDSSPESLDLDLSSSPESNESLMVDNFPLSPSSSSPSSSNSSSSSAPASSASSPRVSKQNGKVRLVCIIGCLDTKPAENEMLRKLLIKKGFATYVIDVGTFEPKKITYPIDLEVGEIVKAAGYDIEQLRIEKQRPKAVVAVKAGLAQKIIELNNKYDFDAVIGMGGTNGTDIVTSAMQHLPESIIKVCITTVAGHQTWEYTKGSGIILFDPITDIGGGVNSIVEQVIVRAVGALAGMIESPKIKVNQKEAPKKPTIVTSKFGVTTPAVDAAAEALLKQGYDVLQYHMVGTGGKNMEALIRNGAVKGCLDITLAEISSLLDGGVWSAGKDRLSAAVEMCIPQVISLGALDMTMLNKAALGDPRHDNRTIYKCNPDVYAKKNGMSQYDLFARFIINKLQHAKAPVIILIPKKGLSKFDDTYYDVKLKKNLPIKLPNTDAPTDRTKDISWHDSYANQFFFSLINKLAADQAPHIPVIELDCHINDPIFAKIATKLILLAIEIHDTYKNDYRLILARVCQFLKNAIKKENIASIANMDIELILKEAAHFPLPFQLNLGLTLQERFENYSPLIIQAREWIRKYVTKALKENVKQFDINKLNVDTVISQLVTPDSTTPKQRVNHAKAKKAGSEIKQKQKAIRQVGSVFNLPGLLFSPNDGDDKEHRRRNSAPSVINVERENEKIKPEGSLTVSSNDNPRSTF